MNTDKLEAANNLISKIPRKILYSQKDDMDKVNILYSHILSNYASQINEIGENTLLRAIILKQLTLVNMKVTNVDILILNGMNLLNSRMINLNSDELCRLLAEENKDFNDLNMIEKCISQIKSKLPEYLRERFHRKTELAIMEKLYNIIPEAEKLAIQNPNRLRATGESFTNNIIANTTVPNTTRPTVSQTDMYDSQGRVQFAKIDTVTELNEFHKLLDIYKGRHRNQQQNDQDETQEFIESINDENSKKMIQKYLEEKPDDAKMFAMEIKNLMADSSYSQQEKDFIRDKLIEGKIKEILLKKELIHKNVKDLELEYHAEYVNRQPVIMQNPKTGKYFYYDSHSKTLKLLPEDNKMKPVSIQDLERLLREKNISEDEIKKTLMFLQNNKARDDDQYVLKNKEIDHKYLDEYNVELDEEVKNKKESNNKKEEGQKLIRNLIIGLATILFVVILIILLKNLKKGKKK